jgi:hypothetical protein
MERDSEQERYSEREGGRESRTECCRQAQDQGPHEKEREREEFVDNQQVPEVHGFTVKHVNGGREREENRKTDRGRGTPTTPRFNLRAPPPPPSGSRCLCRVR